MAARNSKGTQHSKSAEGRRIPDCRSSDHRKCRTPAAALASGEPVDRNRVELLSGLQFGGRKLRMVGRIRIMLGLQAEGITSSVDFSAFAGHRSIQEVTRVELYARLIG